MHKPAPASTSTPWSGDLFQESILENGSRFVIRLTQVVDLLLSLKAVQCSEIYLSQ